MNNLRCSSMLLRCFLLASIASCIQSGYIITTPRKWAGGSVTQVCLFLRDQTSTPEDVLTVLVKETKSTETEIRPIPFGEANTRNTNKTEAKILVPKKTIKLPEGKNEVCAKILVPNLENDYSSLSGLLELEGTISGEKFYYNKTINILTDLYKVFIQTDKYLYKPGQLVQFRVLSLNGPLLEISTKPYSEIWVESPSRTRIAQWRDVDNKNGLIHLSMQLADEPEEGKYYIKARTPLGKTESTLFKVEEYVLPRFEVKILPPAYILGNDESLNFTVCANYTYGQPVNGLVNLTANNNRWGSYKVEVVKSEKITGCKQITVLAEELFRVGDRAYSYRISVSALVVEKGTDIEIKTEKENIAITRDVIKFSNLYKNEYFKPELPYIEKIRATFPDNRPASNEPMELCIKFTCKKITTDESGIVKVVLPPHLRDNNHVNLQSINFKEVKDEQNRTVMHASNYRMTSRKYYSPSNSSLLPAYENSTLDCVIGSESINFNLPYMFAVANQTSADITVQIISRGQIQYMKTDTYTFDEGPLPIKDEEFVEPLEKPASPFIIRGTVSIPLSLPSTASPEVQVLVWYTRDDGEVVADTSKLDVTKCLHNNVTLSWSSPKVQPGDVANLTISADPNSICSLGVVDKSVKLLSSNNNPLTVSNIFNLLTRVHDDWVHVDDEEYCVKKNKTAHEKKKTESSDEGSERASLSILPHPGFGRRYFTTDADDAIHSFSDAGLFVFSNLTLETRPCMVNEYDFRPVSGVGFGSGGVGGAGGNTANSAANSFNGPADFDTQTLETESTHSNPRTYFPETWLWDIEMVSDTGLTTKQMTLPDTITEWVGETVCVNSNSGLGLSGSVSITTFTPFFVDLTLPASVIRGEILPVKISVFNYLQEPLPVKLTLKDSAEYDILEATGPEAATVQSEAGIRTSCIPLQDKEVFTVRIRPKVIGDMNITVSAFADDKYPKECGSKSVSKRDVLIKPIKVEAEGFPREETWTKFICAKDIKDNSDSLEVWKVSHPNATVKDSERAWVTATGDLLGPTLNNLGSLVRMPYGCGEQNMLNFAPNIFVLQYLDATNSSTTYLRSRILRYMRSGYQQQLRYRHDNGAYSAFGKNDRSGSTWLTAFVVKSFAQAKPFITIDNDGLETSQSWIKEQQLENGCFKSVGKVLHKAMKGGLKDDTSSVILTNYVTVALLEAGENPTSENISKALSCIELEAQTDPYGAALKAYALSLAKHPGVENSIDILLQMANNKTGNSMHWDLLDGKDKNAALQVEIAAYSILALTTYDPEKYTPEITRIVKWISSQRNGQGGFVSTQDTVVALQAMAAYATYHNKEPLDLSVTLNAVDIEHDFRVNKDNKLLQQMAVLPKLPTHVTLDMVGDGCALVQAVLRYNSPFPDPSVAFTMVAETSTAHDRDCKMKRLNICSKYNIFNETSNMVVIEVKLVSGYEPNKDDLKNIISRNRHVFKRYEVDGRTINFYLDELSNEQICFDLRIIRVIDIEDPKPGTVRVYDYYQPEFSLSKGYTLPSEEECNFEVYIPNEDGSLVKTTCWRRRWWSPPADNLETTAFVAPKLETWCLPTTEYQESPDFFPGLSNP